MLSMTNAQRELFGEAPHLPEGFAYREEEILSHQEELAIIGAFQKLPFREFEFRGFLGKRRIVSFGWRYDFNVRQLQQTEKIPDFLLAVRQKAAGFAGLSEAHFQHVLVTEYGPGAAIGWHKDRPEFEDVIGISLGGACVFRFRRAHLKGWERASIELRPRSAYLLQGPARSDRQHSIPPVDSLRYSITFRSLRESTNDPSHRQR
jgi:alkylated DNA repair dioxygenase AlkB